MTTEPTVHDADVAINTYTIAMASRGAATSPGGALKSEAFKMPDGARERKWRGEAQETRRLSAGAWSLKEQR